MLFNLGSNELWRFSLGIIAWFSNSKPSSNNEPGLIKSVEGEVGDWFTLYIFVSAVLVKIYNSSFSLNCVGSESYNLIKIVYFSLEVNSLYEVSICSLVRKLLLNLISVLFEDISEMK